MDQSGFISSELSRVPHLAEGPAVAVLKFLTFFFSFNKQEAPYFHFVLGLINYAAIPALR